jgi:hypothetical protein
MQCCVFTRFVYEVPYLDSFIEHYLKLGFDKVIILYHDIIKYDLSEKLLEDVEFIQVENTGNKLLNEYKYIFKDDYDWVLNVDSDEFLILNSYYPTIKDYITTKLTDNEDINMFQFSWGWIHAFQPPAHYTIKDYIENYKIFIGSKDKENSKVIWVKSLTRVKCIEYMTCHNCVLNKPAVIHIDKRIEYHNPNQVNDNNDEDEDEDDMIEIGEDGVNTKINILPRCYTLKDNTYSEAVLIHINTRNMVNAIIKGFNIHVTQVKRKRIKNLKRLKKFINHFDMRKPIYKETLQAFSKCIGYKVKFPLLCLEKEEINERIRHFNLGTYINPLCNIKYIPEQQAYHLDILQEHMKVLFCVMDMDKFLKILELFGVIFDNTFRLVRLH